MTKNLLAVATLLAIFVQANSALAEQAEADCSYNKSTPIIPDGNIASKDELVAAQRRIKDYQSLLMDFRECLIDVEKGLDPESEDYETLKAALTARSNASIDLEGKVAEEFNQAIRIFKER